MNNKKYLSTMEAAKVLDISRIAIFKKIQRGRIDAIMIGGSYAIKPSVLTAEKKRMDRREKLRSARRAKSRT